MSILTNKKILIVGELQDSFLIDLINELKKQDVVIESYSGTNQEDVEKLKEGFDAIILDFLHCLEQSSTLLKDWQSKGFTKETPIFALVDNQESNIQHVLMLGAADYISPSERTDSALAKIKQIFGQADNFSSQTIFAVPDDKISIEKKGIRVYVIEDDPLLRNLLKLRFDTAQLTYEFACDADNLIAKLNHFKPQAIILDLTLPIKSGSEVLAEIKQDPNLKHVPVIVFSNRDSDEDKKKVFDLGADRFLVKVVTDLSNLIETIDELVN